jgi:NADPH-dependent curcumin reductase CurA
MARYGEGIQALAGWAMEGRLKAREHVVKGLETFPETLLMLFGGHNSGKLVIQVAEE